MPHVDRDAATVSQEERAEIRELHCRTRSYLGNEGRVCEECLGDYPCLYVRTLDALEAAERRESAWNAEWDRVRDTWNVAFAATVYDEDDGPTTATLPARAFIEADDAICELLNTHYQWVPAHDARQKGAAHE